MSDTAASATMAPQKRTAAEAEGVLLDGVDAVVFDIEGTTTPITFVKDTLFPYARKNVESFLTEKYEDAETIKDIAALRELAQKDKAEGKDGVVEIPEATADKAEVIKAVVENVKWQMDNDRKSTELKQLQGHIWKKGYEAGDLKAQLFDDVPGMLKVLSDDKALYVYSSGSVEAQKLLFSHTEAGDISGLFEDFFDTNMGQKTEKESYQKIAAKIKLDADKILFLTDLPNEAAAAVSAGWKSALVIRPGNADLEEEHLQNFACIEHLEELYGDEDDEEFAKRPHTDNGEADDDDDEEVDEEDEGEEEEGDDDEGEGEDA